MNEKLQTVMENPEQALAVNYPDGGKEYMFFGTWNGTGVLLGIMDGKGPMPLDPGDANTVVNKYSAELVEREQVPNISSNSAEADEE